VVLRLGQASTQETLGCFRWSPNSLVRWTGVPRHNARPTDRGVLGGASHDVGAAPLTASQRSRPAAAQYVAARRTPGAIRPGSAARPALYPGVPAPPGLL